jgi:XTP/dITP diphosphohydrolase
MPSPPEPVLLATRSHDKAREIRQILQHSRTIELVTMGEAGLDPEPEEDDVEVFDTFVANALAKAAWFARRSGMSVIADDSGICVAALGGAPGVRSRRFAADYAAAGVDAGTHGVRNDDDVDRANNDMLLSRLARVAPPDRGAHYACAAALQLRDGRRIVAVGTCSGTILTEPRGSLGFGYDPLFFDPAIGLSFGEIDPGEKNRRSHRARAFRALASWLI